MSTQYSTGLMEAVALTGSLRSALNEVAIYYYSGTPPASVHDATTGGNNLLAVFTVDNDGSTGLTFDSTVAVSTGVVGLAKTPSESWEAEGLPAASTGTLPTFARIAPLADGEPDGASTSDVRIQCPIGPTVVNGILRTGLIAENDALALPLFVLNLPTGAPD